MEEVEAARERELQATEAKLGPANSVRPYQRKRVPKNQEAEITRLQKRSVRLQKEAAITQRQALLEEEPSLEQVAQKKAVQLRLRLPSGENVKRNFLLSHPVEQVRLFAEISYPFLIYNPYILLAQFPRTVFTVWEESLADAGITQSMGLVVELSASE